MRPAAAQVSYAIGVAQPLSVHVDTYGTGTIPDKEILAKVLDKFDFRPGAQETSPFVLLFHDAALFQQLPVIKGLPETGIMGVD